MFNPRSSHGICFMNQYIYMIGGFEKNQTLSNKCERFNIETYQFFNIILFFKNTITFNLYC